MILVSPHRIQKPNIDSQYSLSKVCLFATFSIGLLCAKSVSAEPLGCKFGSSTKQLFSSVVIVDTTESVVVLGASAAQITENKIVLRCVPSHRISNESPTLIPYRAEWVEVKLTATLAI